MTRAGMGCLVARGEIASQKMLAMTDKDVDSRWRHAGMTRAGMGCLVARGEIASQKMLAMTGKDVDSR